MSSTFSSYDVGYFKTMKWKNKGHNKSAEKYNKRQKNSQWSNPYKMNKWSKVIEHEIFLKMPQISIGIKQNNTTGSQANNIKIYSKTICCYQSNVV